MLKNSIFFFAMLVCSLVAAAGCLADADGLPKVVRITTSDWPPFTSTTLPGHGIYGELVDAVFEEMGITPEYVFYPWKRGEKHVAAGKIWATFPFSINIERSALYFFSDPLSDSSTELFYYGPDKGYQFITISDLKKYRIGGTGGYYFAELFANAGVDAFYTPDEVSGLKMLRKGRIDLFALNRRVGWYLISTSFGEDMHKFHTLKKPLSVYPLRLMVSRAYPNSQELLRHFNKAMARVKVKKSTESIAKKHNLLH